MTTDKLLTNWPKGRAAFRDRQIVQQSFLLILLMLGGAVLSGCAAQPRPTLQLQVQVPEVLKSCPRPELPAEGELTIGDLAIFSIEQEAALNVCDSHRGAAVSMIEAVNKALEVPEPKAPWWKFKRKDS